MIEMKQQMISATMAQENHEISQLKKEQQMISATMAQKNHEISQLKKELQVKKSDVAELQVEKSDVAIQTTTDFTLLVSDMVID